MLASAVKTIPLFVIATAALALVVAVVAIVLVLILRSTVDRRFSGVQRKTSMQPEQNRIGESFELLERMQRTLGELATLVGDTRAQGNDTHLSLKQVVRVLADSRAEEIVSAEQEGAAEKVALRRLYEVSRAELSPFVFSLSSVTPSVHSLSVCPTHNNVDMEAIVRTLVANYEQMQNIDSELASKLARICDVEPTAASAVEGARIRFDSGALAIDAYLRQVMSTPRIDRLVLPDPDVELAHYRELAGTTTEKYLSWLDRINELRDFANETSNYEVSSASTQIIRQSRSVLEPLNIELDDVEIGRTRYDSRLHDLLHTVPRPDTRPETVIGVRKLGYRRNGTTVRKPQVVVAAAAGN